MRYLKSLVKGQRWS